MGHDGQCGPEDQANCVLAAWRLCVNPPPVYKSPLLRSFDEDAETEEGPTEVEISRKAAIFLTARAIGRSENEDFLYWVDGP
jgi:hypothetical protein